MSLVCDGTGAAPTLEVTVASEGTLKPSAIVGALLDLPDTVPPALRVHKLATRFRAAAPEPAALAAAR